MGVNPVIFAVVELAAIPVTDGYGYILGVCPEGWRVTTLEEYQTLYAFSSPDL